MGSFSASLRTIGDRRALPATVTIDDGRIVIQAGDQPIGDWSLQEIHLEPTGGSSYRMAAEGEHILIDVPDTEAFKHAIEGRARIRKRPKLRPPRAKVEARVEKTQVETTPVTGVKTKKAKTEKARAPRATKPLKQRLEGVKTKTGGVTETEEKPEGRLDRVIAAAERRWGSLLPSWVFTRVMAGIIAGGMLLTVIVPGLVSSFLLISGLLLVLLGAIAYTDPILAAKWFPGRTTAMHVLLVGVAVLMLGVLVGVIA